MFVKPSVLDHWTFDEEPPLRSIEMSEMIAGPVGPPGCEKRCDKRGPAATAEDWDPHCSAYHPTMPCDAHPLG